MPAVDDFFNSAQGHHSRLQELVSRLDAIHKAAPVGDITTTEQARYALSILQSQEQYLAQLKREADYEMQMTRTASEAATLEVNSSKLGRRGKKELKDRIQVHRSQLLTQTQGYKNLVDQWLIQVADWKRQLAQFIRDE